MKRRRWDSKIKTKIVLNGLSGRPVSEICNEYGIHQNQYYIHSALGCRTPVQAQEDYYKKREDTLLNAA